MDKHTLPILASWEFLGDVMNYMGFKINYPISRCYKEAIITSSIGYTVVKQVKEMLQGKTFLN